MRARGNDKIASHFETLPSGAVERKKIDFPTSTPSGSPAQVTANPTAPIGKAKPAAAAPSKPLAVAEQQLQAKLKREQMNDAFHGRLAGIKHNVDALNHRLTDFEDKVHKEDVKLDKGNPDDFHVNLD